MTSPLIKKLPFHVNICEPGIPAFQRACALIRMGYVFAQDVPVQIMPNGNAIFTLLLGTPDHNAVNAANEATEHGLAMEAAQYQRDVEERAKMMLEDYKREQLQKQVSAEIADHKRKIAEIERAAAIAAAKLK